MIFWSPLRPIWVHHYHSNIISSVAILSRLIVFVYRNLKGQTVRASHAESRAVVACHLGQELAAPILASSCPHLAPTWPQVGSNLPPVGPTWPQFAANGPKTPTGPNLAPTWSQHDITWPQLSPNLEPTWSQNALTQFDLEPRSPHGKNARVGRIGVCGIASASDYHGIYVKL